MSEGNGMVAYHERRVEELRWNVLKWYNAHRDAVEELCKGERELRIARRDK